MQRVQRKTLKRRKEGHKRNYGKIRKIEGNINMSKRLTIAPEFFTVGVISAADRKTSSNGSKEQDDHYCVLDNFHGLFNKCLNIRRSQRILNKCYKKKSTDNIDSTAESSYNNLRTSSEDRTFNEDINEVFNKSLNLTSILQKGLSEPLDSHTAKNFQPSNYPNNVNHFQDVKGKHKVTKSKSLFEEINQLYSRSSQNNCNPLNIPSNSSVNEFDLKQTFCNSLFKQIKINIGASQKYLLILKSRISSEVKKVESALSGKTKMETSSPATVCDVEDNNHDINWDYFSKSEWIYDTPPRQRIIPPKIEESSQLQPAVLYSTQKQSLLFAWKPNAKVDVSGFDAKNEVNKNFLEHVATVNHNLHMDVDIAPSSSYVAMKQSNGNQHFPQVCDNTFNFPKPKLLDHTFKNIFSRPPKKAVKEFSGTSQVKRKLDNDSFLNFKQNESRITKESTNSSTSYDVKKKLFEQNDDKEFNINITNNFKIDDSRTSQLHDDYENGFSFMQADNLESRPEVGFDFKNSAINGETVNFFDFTSNENGMM